MLVQSLLLNWFSINLQPFNAVPVKVCFSEYFMVKTIQTVWIIDDDEIYKYGFRKFVTMQNFCSNIVDFGDCKTAIDFLIDPANSHDLPDVIFLKAYMPVMSGWDFMAAFSDIKSQLSKEIIIYMVAPSVDYNDIVRAKSLPDITDYIIKPIDFHQFSSAFNLDLNKQIA